MNIINPASEEIIADIQEDTAGTVRQKFELVKTGQAAWSAVAVEKRIACIAGFYELLEKEKDELARTLSTEMGKPLRESYNELTGARGRLRFFIDHSAKYLA